MSNLLVMLGYHSPIALAAKASCYRIDLGGKLIGIRFEKAASLHFVSDSPQISIIFYLFIEVGRMDG